LPEKAADRDACLLDLLTGFAHEKGCPLRRLSAKIESPQRTRTTLRMRLAHLGAALAVWLTLVARAARRPQQGHPQRESLRGLVQGGQHVGGGRSVAPRRDAPVPEGGGNPPTPEEEDRVSHAGAPSARDDQSPMDL
jgi:hypothetical protein